MEKLYNIVIEDNAKVLVSEDGWSGEIISNPLVNNLENQSEFSNLANSILELGEIEELANPNKEHSRGQGIILSGTERKAVENRAMEVTRQHLISLGYKMKDTSKNNSFDYLAFNDNEEIKVEVKGTTCNIVDSIRMTHNEVELHKREKGMTALAIVSSIKFMKRGENARCEGGTLEFLPAWEIDKWKIKPNFSRRSKSNNMARSQTRRW